MKRLERRAFSPEFKLEAIRLVTERGGSLSDVARELEVRPEQCRAGSGSWKSAGRWPALR